MKNNAILIVILCLFMAMAAKAQKKDTSAFYMNNNGRMAESKEAADFVRVLLPADNSVDKDLIPVNDVFKDGKRKLIAFTYINSPYIENGLHGAYIEYFHNGHRKYIRTYNNGTLTGECLSYYPNGKLYSVINYTSDGPRLLQCSDSTGKVVANGGNGNWIKPMPILNTWHRDRLKTGGRMASGKVLWTMVKPKKRYTKMVSLYQAGISIKQ
jgi:hypothetical protein